MPLFLPEFSVFQALHKSPLPFWLRIEPRSRSDDFSNGIQAQVCDPLWMLTRQWQFGEFMGDDAATPLMTKLGFHTTEITRVRISGRDSEAAAWNTAQMPLETAVERERVSVDWRMAVQIGQQLERELRRAAGNRAGAAEGLIRRFRERYPVVPAERENPDDLDTATVGFLSVMAGRAINGKALMQEPGLVAEEPRIPRGFEIPADLDVAVEALRRLHRWFAAFFPEPAAGDPAAWKHDKFEYQFAVSASERGENQTVLEAEEYSNGELDWYSFSLPFEAQRRLGAPGLTERERVVVDRLGLLRHIEMTATNVTFAGMPNFRWWEFEDSATDFGGLDPQTTDIGKLLVMEFALIHGDDWFIVPVPLRIGSLCRISSLTVTDVFGRTSAIPRAGTCDDPSWQKWDMFAVSRSRDPAERDAAAEQQSSGDFLFLAPVLGRREESRPVEEVVFIRDEMANMVWAVEKTVAGGLGQGVAGHELSVRRREREGRDAGDGVRAAYRLSSAVSAHWIPYVPVHGDDRRRAVKLQQARIVRDDGDEELQIPQPKSRILQAEGTHLIDEETVSRAARKVQMTMQRARWSDGSTHLWLGRKSGPGRGEGSSGLRFDFLAPKKE